jgi:uncharacterized membrane protein
MVPPRRHPSAASSLAKALNNDPKRISLFVAGICAIWGAIWWYSDALSTATESHELKWLVYGGLAAIAVAALALAVGLWRIGRATISQQRFPPESRLLAPLLILPGDARISGRSAVRRGRILMGIAFGLCFWVLAIILLTRTIEISLVRARSTQVHGAPGRS